MTKKRRANDGKELETIKICGESSRELVGPELKKKCVSLNDSKEVGCSLPMSTILGEVSINDNDNITLTQLEQEPCLPEPKSVPPLRTSVRVQNKKREESRSDMCVDIPKKEEDEAKLNEGPKDDGKKRRRAWEVWSMEDKNIFFEAINEYGKDFEGIQAYLSSKLRKKGNGSFAPKNKDQVRHFYYRTWHKICKYVEFSEVVKKATQELYGLINYGEFRRKVGGVLNEKKGIKLQELIQNGSSTIRVKGKSIRVKTPICRALKKINDFYDEKEHSAPKLPTSVNVEISPANIETWTQVQSLAHNPRVRIVCGLDRSISSIISHLQSKWRSHEEKTCERLVLSLGISSKLPVTEPLNIRLRPPQDVELKLFEVQPDALITSSTMSLSKHEELLRLKGDICGNNRVDRKRIKNSQKVPKHSEQKEDDDGGDFSQEECSDCDADEVEPKQLDVKIKIEPTDHVDENLKNEPIDALRQLKALQTVTNADTNPDGDVVFVGEKTGLLCHAREQQQKPADVRPATPETEDDETSQVEDKSEEIKEKKNSILKGWTGSSCKNVTIGELYLMFGQKKRLCLEYVFDSETENSCEESEKTSASESTSAIPIDANSNLNLLSEPKENKSTDCSEILDKLLSAIETLNCKASNDCTMCGQSKLPKSPAFNRMMGKSPTQCRSPKVSSHLNKTPKQMQPKILTRPEEKKKKPASAKRLILATDNAITSNVTTISTLTSSVVSTTLIPVISTTSVPVTSNEQTQVSQAAGVFKVPLPPAPKLLQPNIYSAQINKLLPKYGRHNRRIQRKHMFVQRQLPLLPNSSSQKSGNIIALNVIQPSGVDGSQLKPVIQVPVPLPISSGAGIRAQVISEAPKSTAISVNVSGHHILSVQMPMLSSPVVTSNEAVLPIPVFTTQSTISPISLTDSSVNDSVKTPISSVLENLEHNSNTNLLRNIMEDAIGDFAELTSPPREPMQEFNNLQNSSPLKTPIKSAFSESSILNNAENIDFPTYLNGPCFSPCPSPLSIGDCPSPSPSLISIGDCPSIPENFKPDHDGTLPILDISMGGTVTVVGQETNQVQTKNPSGLDLSSVVQCQPSGAITCKPQEGDYVLDDNKDKILDLSLGHSNSSFSTLLSTRPTIDLQNEGTLQTPPKKHVALSPLKSDPPPFKVSLFDAPQFSLTVSEPPSPFSSSKFLSPSDSQWLNDEVSDISLSKILGQSETSFNSSNVDRTSVPDDSINFHTTFAALKAQITENQTVDGQ